MKKLLLLISFITVTNLVSAGAPDISGCYFVTMGESGRSDLNLNSNGLYGYTPNGTEQYYKDGKCDFGTWKLAGSKLILTSFSKKVTKMDIKGSKLFIGDLVYDKTNDCMIDADSSIKPLIDRTGVNN